MLFKKVTAITLAIVMVFSMGFVFADRSTAYGQQKKMLVNVNSYQERIFQDMEGYEWAERHVNRLYMNGMVKGVSMNQYQPNKPTTNVQALLMVLRLIACEEGLEHDEIDYDILLMKTRGNRINLDLYEYIKKIYTDDDYDYFFDEIDFTGFKPNVPIKRYQMATYLAVALDLPDGDDLNFDDERAIPDGYEGYIRKVVEAELMVGYENNTFRPMAPLTRAEMAMIFGEVCEESLFKVTFDPSNGEKNVAIDTEINIMFSEEVQLDGEDIEDDDLSDLVELRKDRLNGTKVDFDATIENDDQITIVPDDDLDYNERYYIILKAGLEDEDGDEISRKTSYFTTISEDDEGELVIIFDPEDGEEEVGIYTNIRMEFNKDIEVKDGKDLEDCFELEERDSGDDVDFEVTMNTADDKVTINPDGELEYDTEYRVRILEGLEDEDGEDVPTESITFTTREDELNLCMIEFDPEDGEEDVDVDTEIEIEFNKAIREEGGSTLLNSELEEYFMLTEEDEDGEAVEFTAEINDDKDKVIIIPDEDLMPNTEYYVAVLEGLECEEGNEITPTSITFETEDEEMMMLEIEFNPEDEEEDVDVETEIEIEFSKAIQEAGGFTLSDSELDEYFMLTEDEDGEDEEDEVEFTAEINDDKDRVVITPSDDLMYGTEYYVHILDGLECEDENEITPTSIMFMTEED